jgi:HlyD family secretion protein
MRIERLVLLCAAALVAGCESQPSGVVSGYAEGEYVYVAAPEGGWVTQLLVAKGAQVKTGDALFALDADTQLAQRDQAGAQLKQAQAQLADAQKGRRTEEIAALEAGVGQAQATLALAEADMKRTEDLATRGFAAQSALDQKRAQRDVAAAQLRQARSNLELGRKGARQDEIKGAQAAVDAARAALERAEYALSQRRISTKVTGRVEDTLRRAGEYVPPGGAVIALLPPQNIKVRFFVPEASRAKLAVGKSVGVACSGCAKGLTARITFISSDAEFTPPVIYSIESREKLVWMVEALPDGAAPLSPGQPLDVTLP